jgi:hypothetical protein
MAAIAAKNLYRLFGVLNDLVKNTCRAMVIYFTIDLDDQEMSNLVYAIPQENMLLIKPEHTSNKYYGVIQEAWYGEMIKNLSRQLLNSLDVVDAKEFATFLEATGKFADQRQFTGNVNLLR